MKAVVKIKELATKNVSIVINTDLAKDLKLFYKKVSYITFGVAKCYVNVKISDEVNYNEIQISHDVIEQLKAPKYLSYEIRYDGAGIILGPAIGYLICKNKKDITPKRLRYSLGYVSQYKLLNGAVMIFSLDCVNKDNHTINGYCYNPKNNSWEEGVFPYPSAIYRKLVLSRNWRNHFLSVIGDNLFYNRYFNKWEMYQWFSKNKEMAMYFPETILYSSSNDIQDMLKKYNRIYAKPTSNYGGRGVTQISYEDGKIVYKYRSKGENRQFRFDTMSSAKAYGAKLIKGKQYILQQPINILRCQGEVFDIRCMMLRNDKNKWECSGIVGRVAAKGSIVSNSDSGGIPTRFDVVFRDYLGYSESQFDEFRGNLESIAIKAAESLDDNGIKAAVLGIDFGLDTNRRLWIIEINIRDPGLDLFAYIGDYPFIRKTKTSVMFYGKYLAGFGPES